MFESKHKGPLCMLAASLCWSIGGLCIKNIPWGAMSIIGLRAALAAVVFALFRKGAKVKLTTGNALAAFCQAATTTLFVFANQLTTAAAAVLLQFSAPIFILLIQFTFYKKRPKPSEIIAVTVTILGMFLFFADQLDSGRMLGNLIAIISGLTMGCMFLFNKRPDASPEQSVMIGFFMSMATGLPFVFFDSSITAAFAPWAFIALMGVVQVGLAYVFFSVGIKNTSALPAILIVSVEPVLNPVWVALGTPERPGPFSIVGGAVIITTVVCYNVWIELQKKGESIKASNEVVNK